MAKRMLSLLLCIFLTAALFPAPAHAEDAPALMWYSAHYEWNEETRQNEPVADDGFDPNDWDLNAPAGQDWLVQFVYSDGETLTPLRFEQLEIESDGIGFFPEEDSVFVTVQFSGFGDSATVSYGGASLSLRCELTTFGFYSAPEASEETYLPRWFFRNSPDTVYLVLRDGATLTDVWEDGTHSGASVQVLSDTCVSVTLTEPRREENRVELCFDGAWGNGEPFFEPMRFGIDIVDVRPALVWMEADRRWNDELKQDEFFENPNRFIQTHDLSGSPGDEQVVQFFYRDGDDLTLLTCDELTITGDAAFLEPVQDIFVRVCYDAFSEGEIVYSGADAPVSLGVRGDLGGWNLYSSPEASQETYLRSWEYDGTNPTVYLAARDGFSFSNVWEISNNDADIVLSDDCTWASVTVEEPGDDKIFLQFDVTAPSGSLLEHQACFKPLNDLRPGLVWYWVRSDWDGESQQELYTVEDQFGLNWGRLYNSPGFTNLVQFFLRDGDDLLPVEFDDLEARGVVRLESVADGAYVRIHYDDFGDGEIVYSYQGAECVVRAISDLPDIGFYSAETPSRETYLSRWIYDGSDPTVYLAARNEAFITAVREDEPQGASIRRLSDTCWAITLTDPVRDWLSIRYDGGWNDHDTFEDNGLGLEIVDVRPGLSWYWADWSWNDELDEEEWYVEDWREPERGPMQNAPGRDSVVQFLLKNGEEVTPLTFDDLTVESDCIRLESLQGGAFVRVCFDDFGQGVITAEKDGLTVTAPVFCRLGETEFYAAPEATEENYISTWRYDDEHKTIYLVCAEGVTLEDVEAECDCDVEIGLADDGTWASFTIEELWGDRLEVCYTLVHENGWKDYDRRYDIFIMDVRPGLSWYWADWSWNDELDEEEWYVEDWREPERGPMQSAPGRDSVVQFLLKNGEEVTPLTFDDLTVESDCIRLESLQGGAFVRVYFDDFGQGVITAEKDGLTVTAPVFCRLGETEFYAAPEATEENYISTWRYDDEHKTIYLVCAEGVTLEDVEAECDCDVEIGLADDGTWASFTIEELWGDRLEVCYTLVHENGWKDYDRRHDVFIMDVRPGLRLRWPEWNDDDKLVPSEGWEIDPQLSYMERRTWEVVFFDGENCVSIPTDRLTIDPHMLIIAPDDYWTADPENCHFTEFMAMHTGRTEISYTRDGETYAIPMEINLPTGYFKDQSRSEESYLIHGVNYSLLSETGGKRYAWVLTPFGLTLDEANAFAARQIPDEGEETEVECVPVLRPGSDDLYDLRVTVPAPGENDYDLAVGNEEFGSLAWERVYEYDYVYGGTRLHLHLEQETLPDGTVVNEPFPDINSGNGYILGGSIRFRVRLDCDQPWITSGLTLEDPASGILTWLAEEEMWKFDPRKSGSVTFLYTDPDSGRLFGHKAALVHGGGFYTDEEMRDDTVIFQPYILRYTPGEALSFYFLGEVESLVCESPFLTVTQQDEATWLFTLADTASGYLTADVTVTYYGGWAETYTVAFDDGGGAVEIGDSPEVVMGDDDRVTVTAQLENRAGRALTGDLLAAVYEDGRFLTLVWLQDVTVGADGQNEQALTLNIRSLYSNREDLTVKLYFLSSDGLIPLADAVSVDIP